MEIRIKTYGDYRRFRDSIFRRGIIERAATWEVYEEYLRRDQAITMAMAKDHGATPKGVKYFPDIMPIKDNARPLIDDFFWWAVEEPSFNHPSTV